MCKNLMVKIYPVVTWKFFDWAFSPFVQCSMFSAGSMLHNFRLFIVLYAVRRFLSNYLPTGSGMSLIFQMALIHMKMNENIHVSAIHQSTFSALCMTTWRNYLFLDLRLLLVVQSKINKKVCRTWGNVTFVYLSSQRKGGEILSKAKFIRSVWSVVHCATEWGSSSNNKIVQLFVLFVCGISMTLAILIMRF